LQQSPFCFQQPLATRVVAQSGLVAASAFAAAAAVAALALSLTKVSLTKVKGTVEASLLTSSDSSLLESSLKMVGYFPTTASKRNQRFIWCCACVLANSELTGPASALENVTVQENP